jgi:hypothetical protein
MSTIEIEPLDSRGRGKSGERRCDKVLAEAERATSPSSAKVHRDFAAHNEKEMAGADRTAGR